MIPGKLHRHLYSRTRVTLGVLVTVVILAAVTFSSRGVSSQGGDPQRRELDRVFRRHDRLTLDPERVQNQVKQNGSLTLATSRGTFEMTLTPHDMRAPGYRLEAWSDGGVRVLEPGPVVTYKGTVRGFPNAQARLTINGESVEGLIVMPHDLFFIEPTSHYSATAAKSDFVFYSESDLKESPGECGNTMAEMVAQHSTNVGNQSAAKGPTAEALFGPQQQIAVALEADFEYYTNYGSSTSNVETQILTIMNGVDAIYSNDLGLRFSFSATNLRVWTSDTDPYTTAAPSTLLAQFKDSYNLSPPAQGAGRDIAHLFTGRDLTGTTIGIAYQPGMDCPLDPSSGFGYGLSQDIGAGNRVGLTAHEIGHNLSATHVTSAQGSDCTVSIMNPSINSAAFNQFCQFSKDEITTHAIAMNDCLTALAPECATVPSSSPNIPASGGSVSVNVTAGPTCGWSVAEGAPWLTVMSGASGTGNGSVVLSATGNSCGPRTVSVNIGGQLVSVTQLGNPTYLTDPATATAIAPGQTLSGDLSPADCPTGLSPRADAYMDRYKFNGMAGQKIRIEMSAATDLDTYLYLYGPDGSVVAQNDDIQLGVQTNSRIPCTGNPCGVDLLTLNQTGTYIIIATSFANNDTGGYTLTLTSEPLLLVQQTNPTLVAAMNSVTFQKTSDANNTAFRIFDPFNFSSDQTTRLILFTSDLGLPSQSNPDPSVLAVNAGGNSLVVENVGPFSFNGLNGSYIVVALKRRDAGAMPTNNVSFTVTFRGLTSNAAAITIVP